MAYTRQTRVYALAMIVNPSIKLVFLDKHWTAEEKAAAIEWAKEAVSDQKLMPVARLESLELNTPFRCWRIARLCAGMLPVLVCSLSLYRALLVPTTLR
ncbi:hypothetical protein NUW54_g8803 [Trametes sanguinea]|uniref:Uncharacterized protein n=1 Tax=Trametes sanguinea TaxID=158606 RepID=A0ACC1PDF0_9APHY|nr:hypothetical protein NUW54_g8803 [Trametes sanguinea]